MIELTAWTLLCGEGDVDIDERDRIVISTFHAACMPRRPRPFFLITSGYPRACWLELELEGTFHEESHPGNNGEWGDGVLVPFRSVCVSS